MQADRRRINAPLGGTAPPVFAKSAIDDVVHPPMRRRQPDEHRKVFLRTGIVPSAAGSAYFEVPPQQDPSAAETLIPAQSSLKIICAVHGPRPLPRNSQFSPNLLLTTSVKFAPFATRKRRGYVRDASERDLAVHLETALRGVVIGERWPKSACDVVVTVLEGEEDGWAGDGSVRAGHSERWGIMGVLAGCITVASAAIVDAGIDCVDLVSGGVAALVDEQGKRTVNRASERERVVLDPSPSEHELSAACVVAYLQARDEITELWMKGNAGNQTELLIDSAVKAASLARTVLVEAVKETMEAKSQDRFEQTNGAPIEVSKKGDGTDIAMSG